MIIATLGRKINIMGVFRSKFFTLANFDKTFSKDLVAGVDEVGRGALAGPIVGACVIYNIETIHLYEKELFYVRDSKTLTKKQIEETANNIKNICSAYEIFSFTNEDIDNYGIQNCNRGLIDGALLFAAKNQSNILLIDGTIKPSSNIENITWENFPKADGKSLAVASASIIAKNYRDNLMGALAVKEEYDFANNVGYGAQKHIQAIKEFGTTPHHRQTFLKNIL